MTLDEINKFKKDLDRLEHVVKELRILKENNINGRFNDNGLEMYGSFTFNLSYVRGRAISDAVLDSLWFDWDVFDAALKNAEDEFKIKNDRWVEIEAEMNVI